MNSLSSRRSHYVSSSSSLERSCLSVRHVSRLRADRPRIDARRTVRAAWVDNIRIGESAELIKVLNNAGLGGDMLVRHAAVDSTEEGKAARATLRANTEEAVKLGFCGAPTWQLGRHLVWGQVSERAGVGVFGGASADEELTGSHQRGTGFDRRLATRVFEFAGDCGRFSVRVFSPRMETVADFHIDTTTIAFKCMRSRGITEGFREDVMAKCVHHANETCYLLGELILSIHVRLSIHGTFEAHLSPLCSFRSATER